MWIVTPADGRFAVTRAALVQWQALRAAAGVTIHNLVVASDKNLELAAQYGAFPLHCPGPLGEKLQEGIDHAVGEGADWVCFAGSDDWIHPKMFRSLAKQPADRPPVVTTEHVVMVDLCHPDARACTLAAAKWSGSWGAPPWLMPRWVLQSGDVVHREAVRGMEGQLSWQIRQRGGSFTVEKLDPWAKVDFKTTENLTSYDTLAKSGLVEKQHRSAWKKLASMYPAEAIEEMRYVHRTVLAEQKVRPRSKV